jgi:TolB-like protein
MAAESESDLRFEIGHVLFIDLVGYSKLLIEEQKERLRQLTEIVLATSQVAKSTNEQLVRLPTGDGMALVFRNSSEEPARCALEIAQALKAHPEIAVRMGVHSGPISDMMDVSGKANVAGAGINMAQRVMDCGDAGHILLSQRVADDLAQYRQWAPQLHDLGACEVKHGVHLHLVNLYTEDLGNPAVPGKLQSLTAAEKVGRTTGKPSGQEVVLRWVGLATVILLVAGIAFWLLRSRSSPDQSQKKAAASPSSTAPTMIASGKSIAVLPFENLSSDKENAYFAEGIQDEILTRLAKIGALKVISRTSTAHYTSSPENLPEIARELGVANILEGSVQKAGQQVHINVQLIKAATDDHLWAESYNRKLDDIFGVEAEVAQSIASALNAKLTGSEEQALAQKPTNNPAAYEAYLRGKALMWEGNEDALRAAVPSFEEAVRLDPQFALAWAGLSNAHSVSFYYADVTPAGRVAAEQALAKAEELQPQLPETQLARADFGYFVLGDNKGVRDVLQQLHLIWPSNADVIQLLAFTYERMGEWQKAIDCLDQVVVLNPRYLFVRKVAAYMRCDVRDFDAALRVVNEALKIWPDDINLLGIKAQIFHARGQLDQAQLIVDRITPGRVDYDAVGAVWYQAKLRRNPKSALKLFEAFAQRTTSGFEWLRDAQILGELQELAGDKRSARATFTTVRENAEAGLREQPDNIHFIYLRASALAGLGERDPALQAIDKAIALRAGDARAGLSYEENRARILARFGDKDAALTIVQHLLQVPYEGGLFGPPLTPALLRLDPDWDNLRGDPRFEKLCQDNAK